MSGTDDPQTGRREPAQDQPAADQIDGRAHLLPEEQAAGSDDPGGQAEAILAESEERTDHPDPESSTQTTRRHSEDTV